MFKYIKIPFTKNYTLNTYTNSMLKFSDFLSKIIVRINNIQAIYSTIIKKSEMYENNEI